MCGGGGGWGGGMMFHCKIQLVVVLPQDRQEPFHHVVSCSL